MASAPSCVADISIREPEDRQLDEGGGGGQSHLYGRVTKKYDIYQNNNKKKTGYFGKFETVGTYNRPDIQENFFMKYFFFIPL